MLHNQQPARRVLVVSQLPPPVHGSTVMTLRLVEAFGTLGIDVRVVNRRFSISIGEVGQTSLRKITKVPALVRALRRELTVRPDAVVFFLTNRPGSFLVDVLLMRIMQTSHVPIVAYIHTVGFRDLASRGGLWQRLVANTLRIPRRVVVLGPALASDVSPWVDPARIRFIRNASEDERCEQPRPRHSVRLLFLSNLTPEKGVHSFIALVEQLREILPGLQADIAGGATLAQEEDLTRRLARSGLSSAVTWHGSVDAAARCRLLNNADLMIFPSRYPFEAQPLALIEAASAGLPAIAYDIGGLSDLEWLRLVPEGDESALRTAVISLLNNPDELRSASRRARTTWEQLHSMVGYSRAWNDLLSEL
ncbi:MAG: glycosyltransferase family 4 protein [Microbacteriaceae bacterium]